MKTIKEMLSSKFMILFLILLVMFSILYVKDVNAADKLPQEFPDLSYLYNELDTFLKENPKYVETLDYLIQKLSETEYKYIVYLVREPDKINGYRVYANISRKGEFYITYKDNFLRYTKGTAKIGGSSSALHGEDWFILKQGNDRKLTKEKVDDWIGRFILYNEEVFSKTGTDLSFLDPDTFRNSTRYEYFYSILLYSSMDKKKMDVHDYAGFTFSNLNNEIYGYGVPTFAGAYSDYGIGREIEKDNELKIEDESDSKHVELEDKDENDLDFSNGLENTDNMSLLKVWTNKLFKYFPIYNQIVEIKKAFEYKGTNGKCIWFSEDDKVFYDICVPTFNLKFNILGLNIEENALDLRFYAKYRKTVFFYMRLLIYTITVLGSLHVLSEFFK